MRLSPLHRTAYNAVGTLVGRKIAAGFPPRDGERAKAAGRH